MSASFTSPLRLQKLRLSVSLALLWLLQSQAQAAPREEIDAYVDETLTQFYHHSPAGKALARRAAGMLVFPKIYKAGFAIGGEYGEGSLRIKGTSVGYYRTVSASIGFQLGAQRKSQIILFMTQEALEQFRNSEGWEIGVDGSVAIASFGAGEDIDSHTAQQSIIGFIFSNEGLMFNLNLEGSRITPMPR